MFGFGMTGTAERVVDFGPYLAEKQYRAEYKWKPTENEERALVDLALEH